MENGENKDLQGRREFFKEAAKKALPILGLALMASTPILTSCSKDWGCDDKCVGSCKSNCKGDCKMGCKDTCSLGCTGSCDDECYGGCKHNNRLY